MGLFLDDDENTELPYLVIQVSGECALPRLVFDRPEIIFPIVPLGIETR